MELSSGLEVLGSSVFLYCASLKDISLPVSLQTLGSNAFMNCSSLESIVIPQGVKQIDSNTFSGCTALTSVTLNVGLQSVYCLGTQEEWNALCSKINAGSIVGNEILTSSGITVYYYSETPPEAGTEGNYWHYDEIDGITPVLWETQA